MRRRGSLVVPAVLAANMLCARFNDSSSNGYTYNAKLAYPAVRTVLDAPRITTP